MTKGKTILKKSLSILVSVAIVLGMMGPWSVLAAIPVDPDHTLTLALKSDQTVVQPGDTLVVGAYISGNDDFNLSIGTLNIYYNNTQLGGGKFQRNAAVTGVTGIDNPSFDEEKNEGCSFMMMTGPTKTDYYSITTEPQLIGSFSYTVQSDASGEIDFRLSSPGTNEVDDDGNVVNHFDSDFCMVETVEDEETYTYFNTTFEDDTNITIQTPATDLTIQNNGEDVSEMNLEFGSSATLTANVTPENATVPITWSSSNPEVLEVDPETGALTTVATGDAVITATANNQGLAEDVSASCTVHVVKSLNSISLDKSEAEIVKNQTTELTVSYDPEDTTDNKDVTWSVIDGSDCVSVAPKEGSENNSVAVVTGLKEGDATVQAQVGDKTATCSVTVTESHIDSISLNETSASFAWNDEDGVDLSVSYDPEDTTDDKTIEWTTSGDEDVLNVQPSGDYNDNAKITANKPGTATVTATVAGTEISASCEITVTKADLDPVTFPSGATMTYGQTLADVNFTDAGDTTNGSFAFTNPNEIPTAAGTFEYEMTFTPTEAELYNTQTQNVSVTVNKKAITVTADDQEIVYKEALPDFTYTVPEDALVGEDTQEDLGLTLHAVNAEGTEMTADTVQGGETYDIVEKECTSANYDVTVTKGTLTVTQAQPEVVFPTGATLTYGQTLAEAALTGDYSQDGTFEFVTPDVKPHVSDSDTTEYGIKFTPNDANYQSVTSAITVTVSQKVITVNANDATRPYGEANPEFTYEDVNAAIETGDDLGLTLKAVVAGTEEEVTEQSPAGGTYSIVKDDCTNADYDVTVQPGVLTITAATPTVTFPTGASLTYGQKLSEATLEGGSATFNNEEVPGSFVFDNPDEYLVVQQNGNNRSIKFVPDDTTNFATVGQGYVPVEVKAANVTVTPTDTAKDYLAAVPTSYAYTAEGMVRDEDPSVLNATFVAYESYTSEEENTPITEETDAGTYPIIATGYNNPNYNVTFNEGTLTINKINPTLVFPTNVTVEDGSALSTATYTEGTSNIEGTFAFDAPATVLALGDDGNYSMTFTPSEEYQKNYNSVTEEVYVKVVPQFSIDSVTINPSGAQNWNAGKTRLLVMKSSYQDFTAEVIGDKVPDDSVVWEIETEGCADGTTLEEATNADGDTVERLKVDLNETNKTIKLKATSVLDGNYFAEITVNIANRGDFDGNAVLNAQDYKKLQTEIANEAQSGAYNQFYDLNGDSKVNAIDLTQWLQIYANPAN